MQAQRRYALEDAMTAQQHQKPSLDLIYGTVAGLAQQQPESAQEELWQDRLSSLQQWICELLIENQRLRMSWMSMASRAHVELQPSVDRSKPPPDTSVAQEAIGAFGSSVVQ
jgi:hypothetical protein